MTKKLHIKDVWQCIMINLMMQKIRVILNAPKKGYTARILAEEHPGGSTKIGAGISANN